MALPRDHELTFSREHLIHCYEVKINDRRVELEAAHVAVVETRRGIQTALMTAILEGNFDQAAVLGSRDPFGRGEPGDPPKGKCAVGIEVEVEPLREHVNAIFKVRNLEDSVERLTADLAILRAASDEQITLKGSDVVGIVA